MTVFLQIFTEAKREPLVTLDSSKGIDGFHKYINRNIRRCLGADPESVEVDYVYTSSAGTKYNLPSLEDALQAARVGGQPPYLCTTDSEGVSFLKIHACIACTAAPANPIGQQGGDQSCPGAGGEVPPKKQRGEDPTLLHVMLDLWPIVVLSSPFMYKGKPYSYDPAKTGGTVWVLCNHTEAKTASENARPGLPSVYTCMTTIQHNWARHKFPLEAPTTQETFHGEMTKVFQDVGKWV
ncbi:hypothetical protein DUNSADRAFT_17393 [Dunaliella salina]|uniref:Uncharacterized protein n=1 Tax=Dunaliella salina TaxID=3046 RepID=A0ABQ7G1U7_DUNSA|nr:hypothetical protein DUNSADRAFT_17393 [Dunaliella salina]|eukprot:KAF5828578.1 hypothetical protein DUNSADRAFT_17393 [Dunaliella salina]